MTEFNNLKRYYIVNESPVRIISKCKSHSKGTLMSFLVGACLVYMLLNWVPEVLSIFFPTTTYDVMVKMNQGADIARYEGMPRTAIVVLFYSMLFNGVFRLGECLYCLTYIRNKKAEYGAIFEGLTYYLKTLAIHVVQSLIVGFWTMLFIIPGLIAAINFSQSFYIFADDPSKGVFEVLAESKQMMMGNRMNYVRLILVYVPYILISYAVVYVAALATTGLAVPEPVMVLIGMLFELPIFFVLGYMSLGRTVFYELIINGSFARFKYAGQEAFREMENTGRP